MQNLYKKTSCIAKLEFRRKSKESQNGLRTHKTIDLIHQYRAITYLCSWVHGSSIRSVFAWHASVPEFGPHVRHILLWRLGHENISTAILPLPLIQERQLSVTGERMCTKY